MKASDRIPFRITPMLATLVRQPFHREGWTYEEKYDGYRILAYKEGRMVTLLSRNGKDRSQTYAVIAEAIARLAPRNLLLDGEIVVFDRKGVSRFQLLQNMKAGPKYAAFDCLYRDGRDFRKEPLHERRMALADTLGGATASNSVVFPSEIIAANGLKAFEIAKRKHYEGVLAKNLSSPYIEGRSNEWLKFKVHQEEEFVIVGYTAPAGARKHFGALLLGAYDRGELHYVGKVGTGFTRQSLTMLAQRFQPLVRKTSSVVDPPRERGVTFVAPRLVAQISFGEWTSDKKLRQPVFLGLRDDKEAQAVEMPLAP